MEQVGTVRELWRYPVKSFRGESLRELAVDERGIVGDRAFAVRDEAGKLGSGKTTRRFRFLRDLFDFAAETRDGAVLVHAPGGIEHRVGDPELDALLSARYGESLAVLPEGDVPHFDAGPVHILTSSSLQWAEHGFGTEGGRARRYRPNILVETSGTGLVEDAWLGARLLVGSCELEISRQVERCVMPTFPQEELPRAPDLLRFLTKRNGQKLGVYADVLAAGTICVGDPVALAR